MVKLISVARKNIISCNKDVTVDKIAKILVDHNISSVLVKNNEMNKYIGIIDDRMLFHLLTTRENPIPKKAKDIIVPLNKINGTLEIDEAWAEMEKVKGEIFC